MISLRATQDHSLKAVEKDLKQLDKEVNDSFNQVAFVGNLKACTLGYVLGTDMVRILNSEIGKARATLRTARCIEDPNRLAATILDISQFALAKKDQFRAHHDASCVPPTGISIGHQPIDRLALLLCLHKSIINRDVYSDVAISRIASTIYKASLLHEADLVRRSESDYASERAPQDHENNQLHQFGHRNNVTDIAKASNSSSYLVYNLKVTLFAVVMTAVLTLLVRGSSFAPWIVFPLGLTFTAECYSTFLRSRWRPKNIVAASDLPAEPRDVSVAICISTMLHPRSLVAGMQSLQEAIYQCAGDASCFVILLDALDADQGALSSDEEAQLKAATDALRVMQEQFPSTVIRILLRERCWSSQQQCWMGWERKRGKILEFMRLIKGGSGKFIASAEFLDSLVRPVTHVLSLDEDSRIIPGSFANLVSMASAGEFTPVLDENGCVVKGHGILVPSSYGRASSMRAWNYRGFLPSRAPAHASSCAKTSFFMHHLGTQPYCGKGLIDVDCYLASAASRIKENEVLSHDTVETVFLRPALAPSCGLTESLPRNYHELIERSHRWTRGDWQNIPTLLRHCRKPGVFPSIAHGLMHQLRLLRFSIAKLSLPVLLLLEASRAHVVGAFGILLITFTFWLPHSANTENEAGPFGIAKTLAQTIVGITLSLRSGLRTLHAIGTAALRMACKGRTLQWTASSLSRFARVRATNSLALSLMSLALGFALILYGPHTYGVWAISFLWLVSPLVARAL